MNSQNIFIYHITLFEVSKRTTQFFFRLLYVDINSKSVLAKLKKDNLKQYSLILLYFFLCRLGFVLSRKHPFSTSDVLLWMY
jgi:hypothetical protein